MNALMLISPKQEYDSTLPNQCTGTALNPPKYYLGNYCYESCPSNSVVDGLSYQCQCSQACIKIL